MCIYSGRPRSYSAYEFPLSNLFGSTINAAAARWCHSDAVPGGVLGMMQAVMRACTSGYPSTHEEHLNSNHMTKNDDKNPKAPNEHIEEALQYYLEFPRPPKYAVLINGPWGIGKTFLIKQYLDRHFNGWKDPYVYVSLFGLSNLDEIDTAVLAALYPTTTSKPVKVVGRIAKAALKKFAADPELKLTDFLSNKDKTKVYVFDDLERCQVDVLQVLGYINDFVEHGDAKVLVIANEDEITADDTALYARQREKLIGRTLRLESSFDQAFEHFLSELDSAGAKVAIAKNTTAIKEIHTQSGLHNLRILQQTLWDFVRIYEALLDDHRNHDAAVSNLIQLFFAVAYEHKSGRLTTEQIVRRQDAATAALVHYRAQKEGKAVTGFTASQARYPEIDLTDKILSNDALVDALAYGSIDRDTINIAIRQSKHFVAAGGEPAWRVVWYAFTQPDDVVERAIRDMETAFAQRSYTQIGEILHVFGLRLWLAKIGALGNTRKLAVKQCRDYVDVLYSDKLLPKPSGDLSTLIGFKGSFGLAFFEADSKDFRELQDHLTVNCERAERERYPEYACDLLKTMQEDVESFLRQICHTNSGLSTYARVPVFACLDVDTFVETLLAQPIAIQDRVWEAFRERYRHGALGNDLAPEVPWLVAVRRRLTVEAKSMKPIAKSRLERWLKWSVDSVIPTTSKGKAAKKSVARMPGAGRKTARRSS